MSRALRAELAALRADNARLRAVIDQSRKAGETKRECPAAGCLVCDEAGACLADAMAVLRSAPAATQRDPVTGRQDYVAPAPLSEAELEQIRKNLGISQLQLGSFVTLERLREIKGLIDYLDSLSGRDANTITLVRSWLDAEIQGAEKK